MQTIDLLDRGLKMSSTSSCMWAWTILALNCCSFTDNCSNKFLNAVVKGMQVIADVLEEIIFIVLTLKGVHSPKVSTTTTMG